MDALAHAPTGFIWDNALKQGNRPQLCEACTSDIAWADQTRKGKPAWRMFTSTTRATLRRWCSAASWHRIAAGDFQTRYRRLGHESSDVVRPRVYQLKQFEEPTMPELNIPSCRMIIPADKARDPTPAAYVADNDLAMGMVVEALSQQILKDTVLFAIEDDPQAGGSCQWLSHHGLRRQRLHPARRNRQHPI